MKTKEQILKWLDKQPWKGEYYEAVFQQLPTKIDYDINFLATAFNWRGTTQGLDVWRNREREYQVWYDSDGKPMSWEEYCANNPLKENDFYIGGNCNAYRIEVEGERSPIFDIMVMSEELCNAFLAYMKLIQLRNAWIKGDNLEELLKNFKIQYLYGGFTVLRGVSSTGLSFPTEEMATEFANTFKDLLETAKPIL